MRSNPIRLSLLTLFVGLVLTARHASPALAAKKPAPKAAVDPAPYLRQLGRIGGNLRDIRATLDVRMGSEPGSKPMTFRLNVAARLPDSVRMDVISSSNGMFSGWKFARVGSTARVYDPISERSTTTDIARLTGRQPIRMDIGVDMFAGIFRPGNYSVASATKGMHNGKPAVLLKLKPRPGVNGEKTPFILSHILVWMDPAKKVPLEQVSYGRPKGIPGAPDRLIPAVTARFVHYTPAGGGLWYPDRVEMTRGRVSRHERRDTKVSLKLTRVNGVLVPTELTTTGGDGPSSMHYSHIRVNTGLPASTFNL